MIERTKEAGPHPGEREAPRARSRERDGLGPEREREPERAPLSFRERSERALVDVGVYGSVSLADLARVHFGGRAREARRAADAWLGQRLVEESRGGGAEGEELRLLTLSRRGLPFVRELARQRGVSPEQRIRSARPARTYAAHETAVYRACAEEGRRLLGEGARIRRVRLHAELAGAVSRRSALARARNGARAAQAERQREAAELGLPTDGPGRLIYPDAQIEYTDAAGRSGRVNVEIATEKYTGHAILQKADAGFRIHASGAAAERKLRSLGAWD